MPKNNAQCGKREERAIVKALEAYGWKARRQPGSGNVDPTLPHDVVWEDSPIGRLLIESKWRATCGWRTLLRWMDGAPILIVKSGAVNQHNVSDPETQRYVFMKLDTFLACVGEAALRSELDDLQHVYMNESPTAFGDALIKIAASRDRIQSAHQNPPQKPIPARKLRGRGFQKKAPVE